jgi:predicted PurR-regulated permease PerM
MADEGSQARGTSAGIWLLLAMGAIVSLVLLMQPFLLALSLAAVIAVLAHPLYERCATRTRRPSLMAIIMTLGITLLVFTPMVLIVAGLLSSIEQSFHDGAAYVADDAWEELTENDWVQSTAGLVGIEASELPEHIGTKLKEQAGPIASESMRLVSGFGSGLVDLGIIVFSLFFLLRDGRGLIERLVNVSPLDRERSLSLIGDGRDAIIATVYGNVGVALAQGALGGVAFALAGIPSAVFWGVAMAFLSLAPLIGAAVIWLPAGVILIVQGEVLRGALLLAFGGGVISTVDNFLRAFIVGQRTELHPLAVFLSVLGGVALLGAAGVFLGPVLFVVAVSVIDMSRAALDTEARPIGLLSGVDSEAQ